jgi:hypothetical protein
VRRSATMGRSRGTVGFLTAFPVRLRFPLQGNNLHNECLTALTALTGGKHQMARKARGAFGSRKLAGRRRSHGAVSSECSTFVACDLSRTAFHRSPIAYVTALLSPVPNPLLYPRPIDGRRGLREAAAPRSAVNSGAFGDGLIGGMALIREQ